MTILVLRGDVIMTNLKMYEYGLSPSKIRELYEYGRKRKMEIGENNVFDFSLGNPSVASPKIVNETLINLINNTDPIHLHGYTSAAGDLMVRESIASYLNQTYGTKHKANLIYLTVGAAASLTISLNALLNREEEVIVLAPFFPEYRVFVENGGGVLKIVKPIEPSFEPDLDEFKKTINKKTKVVIINSPNNPTGVVYCEKTILALTKILKEKSSEYNHPIYLLSDEPYRELVYNAVSVPFISKYYDNTLICYSFSKSLSLPGERIGYIVVSEKCEAAEQIYLSICGAGRALGFVCAPALFQYMIPNCLGKTSDLEVYKTNRDLLYNALITYGYEVVNPAGAFYLFVKSLNNDANKFSELAKRYELLLVPSDSFGYPGYVRIAYCVSTEQVKRSLLAFKKLIEEYKSEE